MIKIDHVKYSCSKIERTYHIQSIFEKPIRDVGRHYVLQGIHLSASVHFVHPRFHPLFQFPFVESNCSLCEVEGCGRGAYVW